MQIGHQGGFFPTFLLKFNKPEAKAYTAWNAKLYKIIKLEYFILC